MDGPPCWGPASPSQRLQRRGGGAWPGSAEGSRGAGLCCPLSSLMDTSGVRGVTAYPDHGRWHRPADRTVCGRPASVLGMRAKLGQEEKEIQSGKPRACLGRGRPWKERALSVPQATGGLLGRQSSELPGYRKCGAISCWAMATPSVLPQGPLGGPSWDLRPFLPWQSPCPREGSVALLQEASLD